MDQRNNILEKFPFSDVLEEHVEVAAILWEQRALAAQRPNHDATSLKKLDRRIDSHLEGRRIEREISQFCVTSLLNDYGGASETFVAAICAFENANNSRAYQSTRVYRKQLSDYHEAVTSGNPNDISTLWNSKKLRLVWPYFGS